MKIAKTLFSGLFIASAIAFSATSALAKDNLTLNYFVNQALTSGITEVETAKLALQRSTSEEVKTFAQQVIDDHTSANKDLAAIAKKKSLKVISEAELLNSAKTSTINQEDGESFDEAYAKNQVKSHQEVIELYNRAALLSDVELAGFATENIPKLTHHLHFAEKLAKEFEKQP